MAAEHSRNRGPRVPGEIPLARAARQAPRLARPHMGWAMVGAVVGWFFGRYVGDIIAGSWPVSQNTTMNNVAVVLGAVLRRRRLARRHRRASPTRS